MFYALLRTLSGVALRWFYGQVDVAGLDRVPARAPLLLTVNHPNALVDALVIAWVFPRRVVMTGKATLFNNPLAAAFFRAAGVVPLIRTKDVAATQSTADARRNERAFALLQSALVRGRAIMIFPEGITGDHPSLAPLKTGAARIALRARDAGLRGLAIVPVGLTFERKDRPRTRIFAEVGEPIFVDDLPAQTDPADVTAEIDRRLRAVTLNFPTATDAARATELAHLLARLFRAAGGVPSVGDTHAPLGDQVSITRRVDEALARGRVDADHGARVDATIARLESLQRELAAHGLEMEDVEIALDARSGARFTVREAFVLLLAGPVAAWGWLNHWIPFHGARAIARRSVESAADPAMRTIVAGLLLVLAFYAAQGALVWTLLGGWPAILYVASLPIAAEVNFVFRERLGRAVRRARAYLRLRRTPQLQAELAGRVAALRADVLALSERR